MPSSFRVKRDRYVTFARKRPKRSGRVSVWRRVVVVAAEGSEGVGEEREDEVEREERREG